MIKFYKTLCIAFLVTLPLSVHSVVSQPSAQDPLPLPNTSYKPEDVVKIVINALANNDLPYEDAGIETTFRFASPSNKVNTGPIEKFTHMVKKEPYGIMVNHQKSEFSELVISNGLAYQIVQLIGNNGQMVAFAFRLSKQSEGRYKDMWMTEAVWPLNQPKESA